MATGLHLVAVRLVESESDNAIVTIEVETTIGTLLAMAELRTAEQTLYAVGFHIQSIDLDSNAFGAVNLRRVARAMLDWLGDDYDERVLIGGIRTSGANPGRKPGVIRITRRLRPAPDAP